MNLRQTAKTAAEANARLLRVPVPKIRIEPAAAFQTPTTRAGITDGGREMALNRDFPMTELDVWMCVSHEMRHAWQIRQNAVSIAYRPADETQNAEYNAQAEEIDAHAWSVVMLSAAFGIRPTLEKNFGSEIWQKISDRAEEIAREF